MARRRRRMTQIQREGRGHDAGQMGQNGKEILSTLSIELVAEFGRGFSWPNLSRMIAFAEVFGEEQIVVTIGLVARCGTVVTEQQHFNYPEGLWSMAYLHWLFKSSTHEFDREKTKNAPLGPTSVSDDKRQHSVKQSTPEI